MRTVTMLYSVTIPAPAPAECPCPAAAHYPAGVQAIEDDEAAWLIDHDYAEAAD